MTATTVNGDMFAITVDGPHAEIRIWRRPDIDFETGAKNAATISEEGMKLPTRGVRRVFLDVHQAPAVAGPKTLASMGALIVAWAAARTRIAVLVSEDPIMGLQYRRLANENAPKDSRVFTDRAEAAAWLAAP